jgi:drug/metabolite transporter (DMT)-like permease
LAKSVWWAIVLTLVASLSMNLGLVLLKKPDGNPASPSTGEPGRVPRRIWSIGLGMLLGGYGLFLLATSFRSAPISLLQPIFASGLLVVAIMAVIYLKERFGALEWLGVALLFSGVIFLGASAEASAAESGTIHERRLLIFWSGAGAISGLVLLILRLARRRTNAEMLFGVLAGVLLGVGYLDTKTFTLAWKEMRLEIALPAFVAMVGGLIGGLVVLQIGFRHGRALIVTALNLVINQVMVVAGGVFCLGESFPHEPFKFNARIAGLSAVAMGTVLLARVGARTKGSNWTSQNPARLE